MKGIISPTDFSKALREYRLDLDETAISSLISTFGKDRGVAYSQFIDAIVGEPTENRKKIILSIYKSLDPYNQGSVSTLALKQAYIPKNHPDVKVGKITQDEALGEFIETLELHIGTSPMVDKESFEKYYAYLSFCIEDDKQFEKLMTSVWKISNTPGYPIDEYKKAPTREGGRPLTVTQAAPFGTTELPTDYSKYGRAQAIYKPDIEPSKPAGYPSGPTYPITKSSISAPKQEISPIKPVSSPEKTNDILLNLRLNLAGRGPRGIFGLYRAFSILDKGNEGKISLEHLKKVLKENRIKINDTDCEQIFMAFDKENSGFIFYDELLKSIVVFFNIQNIL